MADDSKTREIPGTRDKQQLLQGNCAMALGALDAGCRFYAGYPITPQNELIEYMALHMRQRGGSFVQAESELASINLVMGAAVAGARAMTSSSSPGISLMQEGISYLAGMNIPAVIVNVSRGGPGLGSIGPSQSDYFQAVWGGGHGEYRTPVLAPASVQESYEFMFRAFDWADRFLTPVMVLSDAILGQMAEALTPREPLIPPDPASRPWALCGCKNREPRVVASLFSSWDELERRNLERDGRYREIQELAESELLDEEGAETLVVSFGSVFRICKAAALDSRKKGVPVRLFRPKTLFPFPETDLKKAIEGMDRIVVIEMNEGQMLEDIRRVVGHRLPISFHGRSGGIIPEPDEIMHLFEGAAPGPGFHREYPPDPELHHGI